MPSEKLWLMDKGGATHLPTYEVCLDWAAAQLHSETSVLRGSIINALSFNCIYNKLLPKKKYFSIHVSHYTLAFCLDAASHSRRCTIAQWMDQRHQVRVTVGGGGCENRVGQKEVVFLPGTGLFPQCQPPTPPPHLHLHTNKKARRKTYTHSPAAAPVGHDKTHTHKTADCKYPNVQMWLRSKC